MEFDPNILLSNNYIVIDVETTNKDKGHARNKDNKLLLCSVRGPRIPKAKVLVVSEYTLFEALSPYINSIDFIVCHNSKFEFQWLARSGFELHKLPPTWCTQVAEYVIWGNVKKPLSLEACCQRRGIPAKESYVSNLIKSGVCPSEISQSSLIKYVNQDTKITEQLFLQQREEIVKLGLLPVAFTEFMYVPVLADLEMVGLHLNKDKVEYETTKTQLELEDAEKELEEITGGINMSSPKQVAEFLYDKLKFKEITKWGKPIRTPAGGRLTDAATIEKLVATTKKQKRFKELKLEYAKLTKKLSTYLEPYVESCNNNNCIIYGSYNQTVTRNHRLSSSNPNLQNQPREYKSLFCARDKENFKYVKADYKQLEFRAAVFLGQDVRGIKDINDKVDVHAFTASIIGCDRQEAKAHTFKPLYGGQSGTDAERRYYDAFRKKYKDITRTQEEWKLALLRQRGKVEVLVLPNGMRFYWQGTEMTASGYIKNSTTICNYPVSYLATASSGISGIGSMLLWRKLKENGYKSFMVSVTHDDVGLEVHKEEENVKYLLTQCMTYDTIAYMKDVYGLDFNIPLEIEIKEII